METGTEIRPCEACGTPFTAHNYMVKRGHGRFCSHVCASTFLAIQRLPPWEDRFWTRVDKGDGSGCWVWTGNRNYRGYGRFWRGKRNEWAHRISWEIANGQPFPVGMVTMHLCDNPPCVRPDHLRVGTSADNSRDMIDKGRQTAGDLHPSRANIESRPRGEGHARARWTWDQVDEMRRLYAEGLSQHKLAARFGTSQPAIQAIVSGRTWARR